MMSRKIELRKKQKFPNFWKKFIVQNPEETYAGSSHRMNGNFEGVEISALIMSENMFLGKKSKVSGKNLAV